LDERIATGSPLETTAVLTLRVRHETVYRYRMPVHPGEHTLMFRPRDSHDLRLLDASLDLSPQGTVRWYHDVFGNSVAAATFWEPAGELRFQSMLLVQHYDSPPLEGVLESTLGDDAPHYSDELLIDLRPTIEQAYPDPGGRLRDWVNRFNGHPAGQPGRLRTLMMMSQAIREEFTYTERHEPGVQAPLETLDRGAGSCRDFALLMMEAARGMGLAARFVSGYLYDRGLAADGGEIVGGGATHAWLEVYLPGAGWVDFDPTNGSVGNANLIRVAVAREPSQATPIRGTFWGPPDAAVAMDVTVEVTTAAG
jgi:transglutaminase-like putative cysteine protease